MSPDEAQWTCYQCCKRVKPNKSFINNVDKVILLLEMLTNWNSTRTPKSGNFHCLIAITINYVNPAALCNKLYSTVFFNL